MAGENITNLDLYDLLGLLHDATDEAIKKAYRKRALKCHPDKNPDNPKAAEDWERLAKALEVLSDPQARAAYDKLLKARKAAELRNKALESKRRKIKEDLESREASFRREQESNVNIQKNLEKEIKRLREEGSATLKREQELLKAELLQPNLVEEEEQSPKLKIKWKAEKGDPLNGGYSRSVMDQMLRKYGDIKNLLLSSRNGSAIIEYTSAQSAEMAVANEFGLTNNPLRFTWISGKPERSHTEAPAPMEVSFDDDFERSVLQRLIEAQEKKERDQGAQSQTEHQDNAKESTSNVWCVQEDGTTERIPDEFVMSGASSGAT